MATDLHTETGPSVTQLMRGIITDAQQLISQQLALFRVEIKDDFRKTMSIVTAIIAGFVLVQIGGGLLCFMLVYLLQQVAPALPLWASFGIIGALVTLIGGGICYAAISKFHTFNPLPDESAQALKENVRWITNPK